MIMEATETTELSLSQLVTAAGLTGATSRDETVKIPEKIDEMIGDANRQLATVTAHIGSLDELTARIAKARGEKAAEKERVHKTLVGLYDAQAAMAKP